MKTYDFTSRYGTEYEIAFEVARYMYGGLAVEVHCRERGDEWWEPYGTLTKNLGDPLPGNWAYIDANNLPDLCEFVIDKGWATQVGEGHSGFCTYPLVEFTDEFLEMVCVECEEE